MESLEPWPMSLLEVNIAPSCDDSCCDDKRAGVVHFHGWKLMCPIVRPAPPSYGTCVRPGGLQVPAPGGRIDGGSVFGQ